MQIFIDMLKHRGATCLPFDAQARIIDALSDVPAPQPEIDAKLLDAAAKGVIDLLSAAAQYDLPLEQMVAEMLTAQGVNKPCRSAAEILQLYRSGKLQNAKNPATSLELAIVAMRKSKDD